MRFFALAVLFQACGGHAQVYAPIQLSDKEAQELGARIWQNEGGGKKEALVWWNEGEQFASMGIAHFIWYPAQQRGPFEETFPRLLVFLEQNNVRLPGWLRGAPPCPWNDRDSFRRDLDSDRVRELRGLLEETVGWQARWVANRLEQALPQMLKSLPKKEREPVRRQFYRVARSPDGFYALVDYLNFKGEGISPKERYHGLGWGLLQVLQEMRGDEPGPKALDEFASAAERVLRRRVENSPPERNEARWLETWLKRVKTYRTGV